MTDTNTFLNTIKEHINALFSERVSYQLVPLRYENDCLTIQCYNEEMKDELSKRSSIIKEYINDKVANCSINSVEFVSRN